ncbi:unnamed protein product [Ostreobium quekettii]|uniref:Uncharacterized protein n=1 Tax=Ostreobium quekettii TaxID=121088 RepID=A0A8S1IZF6_9CHLO|nr:unnamed protein product [Ostreobium quekettii]|eukprot:evm.model.scf_1952.3 EVM.evm.TU.scf_1952.3   scf_1952:14712-15333(-)
MPFFLLSIKANLENVASLSAPPGFQFCLTVKNPQGEDTREGIWVSAADEFPISGSRGTANYVMRWVKGVGKEASMNVTEVKGVTHPEYTGDDSDQFVPIVAFECRGLDPIELKPTGGWRVESTSGKVFDDVDLSEGDWAEYDEDAGETVGVYEFTARFDVHKGK